MITGDIMAEDLSCVFFSGAGVVSLVTAFVTSSISAFVTVSTTGRTKSFLNRGILLLIIVITGNSKSQLSQPVHPYMSCALLHLTVVNFSKGKFG